MFRVRLGGQVQSAGWSWRVELVWEVGTRFQKLAWHGKGVGLSSQGSKWLS